MCFFYLKQLRLVKPYNPSKDTEKVIHLPIMSRLDYCNSLYYILDQSSIHGLRIARSAVACLLSERGCDHISPVLSAFLWLPLM